MSDWFGQARHYLQYERNDEYAAYVERLVDEKQDDELKRLFGQRLTFGTAGIRGAMGPGYSQMNDLVIIQTSQGLVSYLLEHHGRELCKKRGVIIGHDARHNSAKFSHLTILAFLQADIPVYYCDYIIPTPFVAFGVKLFECICGIMITASHNPKQDNGFKVFWANGAQILSPHDRNIQRHIERPENQEPWAKAWRREWLAPSTLTAYSSITSLSSLDSHRQQREQQQQQEPVPKEFEGLLFQVHGKLSRGYFDYIQQLVSERVPLNKASSLSITWTPMHGVGHTYLSRALEIAGFQETFAVEAQREPNPEFPTVRFPNPEEAGALDLAFEIAAQNNSHLILANDPDADRCAAALYDPETKSRRVLSGNEIGALLGWWIWHCHEARRAADAAGTNDGSGSALASHIDDGTANKEGQGQEEEEAAASSGSHGAPSGALKAPADCYMLSTAVSSRFLGSMAKLEGFQFVETLTGFKYMGNVAHDLINKQNKSVLFAYEEAIGYMVDSRLLDKDGISAAVQLAQCAAYLASTYKRTLESQLAWLYTRYGYHYCLNSYYICHEPRTVSAIFHRLQTDYPSCFGGSDAPAEFVITRIRDLNNGFDNGSPDNRATLPTSSSSFMVTFFIGTEIQFTIRTSGTEPKIKYYSEIVAKLPTERAPDHDSLEQTQNAAKLAAQAKLGRFVSAAVERCLRPSQYNLEPAAGVV